MSDITEDRDYNEWQVGDYIRWEQGYIMYKIEAIRKSGFAVRVEWIDPQSGIINITEAFNLVRVRRK